MTVQSTADERFGEAARYIQEGSWSAATGVLRELLQENPQQEEISSLLEHVEMRARVEGQRIKGRSPLQIKLSNRKFMTKLGVILLLILLGRVTKATNRTDSH